MVIANTVGNGGISASRSSSDKSANYTLDTSGFAANVTYTILPLSIQFIWNATNTFVYNGSTHKVVLDGIKFYAGTDCVSGDNMLTPKSTPTDIISGGITTTYSFVGRTENETLFIKVASDLSIDYLASGSYASVANYEDFSVSGNNAANIATIDGNYTYAASNSTTFSIYKSIISVSSFETLAIISKTYDGTTTIDATALNNQPSMVAMLAALFPDTLKSS